VHHLRRIRDQVTKVSWQQPTSEPSACFELALQRSLTAPGSFARTLKKILV